MHFLCYLFFFIALTYAHYDKYDILDLIGNGASCFVYRVQNKSNGNIYAMKAIRKSFVMKNGFFAQIQSERDILAFNRSPFTLRLVESFSDDTFLYFVTEFASGGDLMTLMIKHDVFSESIARFYLAEILLGVQYLHSKSITLRDLKFENILIDKAGHLKLADFGLATFSLDNRYDSNDFIEDMQLDNLKTRRRLSGTISRSTSRAQRPSLGAHKRSQTSVPRLETRTINHKRNRGFASRANGQDPKKFHSILGTVDYTSYEIWGATGYTSACDLWSLGVILFEMLQGYPIFVADTPQETVFKIKNFRRHLELALSDQTGIPMSNEAIDLIRGLICEEHERLTIEQVMHHPFFIGQTVPTGTTVEEWWSNIKNQRIIPPFVPDNQKPFNEEYFPVEELQAVVATQTRHIQSLESFWQHRKGTMMVDTEQVFDRFAFIGFQ
jgi:protein-serine/threonine kinase